MPNHFESLSHAELFNLRNKPGADQALLAPFEHQAFAREATDENPLIGLGLLAAIPAYQAAKTFGIMGSRTGSENPFGQIAAGFKGVGQGFGRAAKRGLGALFPSASGAEIGGATPTAPISRPEFVGSSSLDRRGELMGLAPSDLSPPPPAAKPAAQPPVKKPGTGGAGAVPSTAPTEFKREFDIIEGNRNPFFRGN